MSGAYPYLMTALCSFLSYPVVYGLVSPWLLRTLVWKRYSALDKANQKYAHWIGASLIYTGAAGTCALLVHHFDQELAFTAKHFILRYDSPSVRYISALLLGYTTGETLAMLLDVGRAHISMFGFVLHHVATCYITLVKCVYPCMPVYANILLATEFSSVWLNVKLLLIAFGFPKSSTIFKINKIVFFLSFSYVRVWLLVFKAFIPVTSLLLTREFYNLELPVLVGVLCGTQFFVPINLYWYALMCRRFPWSISGYGKDE